MGDEWPWLATRLRSEGLCLSVVNKVWTYITYGALLEGEAVGQGSKVPGSSEHHTMRLSFWMNHEGSHSGDGGVPSPTMGGGRVSASCAYVERNFWEAASKHGPTVVIAFCFFFAFQLESMFKLSHPGQCCEMGLRASLVA